MLFLILFCTAIIFVLLIKEKVSAKTYFTIAGLIMLILMFYALSNYELNRVMKLYEQGHITKQYIITDQDTTYKYIYKD